MRRLLALVSLVLVGCSAVAPRADILLPEPKNPLTELFDRSRPDRHWNELLLASFATNHTPPPVAARQLALLNISLYAAATGGKGRVPLEVPVSAVSVTPTDAVNAAGRQLLTALFPERETMWQMEYDRVKGSVPEAYSVQYGESVAQAVFRARVADGSADYIREVGEIAPEKWRPTPPYFDPGMTPHWASVEPFVMTSPDQFLPELPPEITANEFQKDLKEVAQIGAIESQRTAEQSEIARFWADGKGTYTPPGSWTRIALAQTKAQQLPFEESLQVLMTLSVALADAGISCWNAKYHYSFWRPLDAINDARGAEFGDVDYWESYLENPNFPEYPSGHSVFSGAAATVLQQLLSDQPFAATSLGEPGATRRFQHFWDAAIEAAESRIYGGIHYRFSAERGLEQGKALGQWTLKQLAPEE